jgi:hypothetical protein
MQERALGLIMNKASFNGGAGRARQGLTLYHCLYKDPKGDALTPGATVFDVNGRPGRYLFAATHLSKALAFAFSYHHGEAAANGGLDESPDEYVLICGRSETLAKPRHIRVFAFDGAGFEMAHGPDSRQYVSENPVPFRDTALVLETTDVADLMRNGLQIFGTEKSAQQLEADGFLDRFDAPSHRAYLQKIVREEGFVWENRLRGIRPDPVLLRMMADGAPTTAPG